MLHFVPSHCWSGHFVWRDSIRSKGTPGCYGSIRERESWPGLWCGAHPDVCPGVYNSCRHRRNTHAQWLPSSSVDWDCSVYLSHDRGKVVLPPFSLCLQVSVTCRFESSFGVWILCVCVCVTSVFVRVAYQSRSIKPKQCTPLFQN